MVLSFNPYSQRLHTKLRPCSVRRISCRRLLFILLCLCSRQFLIPSVLPLDVQLGNSQALLNNQVSFRFRVLSCLLIGLHPIRENRLRRDQRLVCLISRPSNRPVLLLLIIICGCCVLDLVSETSNFLVRDIRNSRSFV